MRPPAASPHSRFNGSVLIDSLAVDVPLAKISGDVVKTFTAERAALHGLAHCVGQIPVQDLRHL